MPSEDSILKAHNLKATKNRQKVLEIFSKDGTAVSKHIFEQKLSLDRSTIYRTLKSFEENGLIHRVHDSSDIIKYALCSHQCEDDNHQHDHIHFECENCGNTTCVEDIKTPDIKLPEGYTSNQITLFIKGICKNCTN